MYKVMLVDDETLILSGIKFLIDWEKNGCVIAATAGNGQDALEKIRRLQPDIVLADINMPVMDGITLMKKVGEEFPHIVFIILTNLKEFELARQALHYRAVGYLVKSQLEAPALEKELEHAKEEREKRNQLMVVNAADYFEKKQQEDVLNKALQETLFFRRGTPGEEYAEFLKDAGVFYRYACFYIPFDFAAMSSGQPPEKEEKAKTMEWIRELAKKTAEKIFRQNYIFLDTGGVNSLVLFVYARGDSWEQEAEFFGRKLTSTVKNITRAECRVFCTGLYENEDGLKQCAGEYQTLMERYYLGEDEESGIATEHDSEHAGGKISAGEHGGSGRLYAGEQGGSGRLYAGRIGENVISVGKHAGNGEGGYESLGLQGIGPQLYHEITRKNTKGIQALLDSARTRVQNTKHQKSQAIWLLNELNREATEALNGLGMMENSSYSRVSSAAEIENINTRRQVLQWLDMLRNTLLDIVGNGENPGNQIARGARQYVLENIESHVGLQEAADHLGVSAGYLSTIFKREYGQSFIDFINSTKIEYACRLLEEKELMVTEIACRLGYENAYYFSKVFRKYTGMSPTSYQKHVTEFE